MADAATSPKLMPPARFGSLTADELATVIGFLQK